MTLIYKIHLKNLRFREALRGDKIGIIAVARRSSFCSLLQLGVLLLWLPLFGCGGDGGGESSGGDKNGLTIDVSFPLPNSNLAGWTDRITIAGRSEAVDLGSGNRTLISDKTTSAGPAFVQPNGVALDSANNRALVVDEGLKTLLAENMSNRLGIGLHRDVK